MLINTYKQLKSFSSPMTKRLPRHSTKYFLIYLYYLYFFFFVYIISYAAAALYFHNNILYISSLIIYLYL